MFAGKLRKISKLEMSNFSNMLKNAVKCNFILTNGFYVVFFTFYTQNRRDVVVLFYENKKELLFRQRGL